MKHIDKSLNIILVGFKDEISTSISIALQAIYPLRYSIINIKDISTERKINLEKIDLLIIYIKSDNLTERKRIWLIKKRFPDTLFTICSEDKSLAFLSWQINASFFLQLPLTRRGITAMMYQIDKLLQIEVPQIKFNHQNGCYIIDSKDICYCKSDGNYTEIFLTRGQKILISKKIKEVYLKFSSFHFLVRIGKSYIINLQNITKINEKIVYFKNIEKNNTLELSSTYMKRIKEYLLWFAY